MADEIRVEMQSTLPSNSAFLARIIRDLSQIDD